MQPQFDLDEILNGDAQQLGQLLNGINPSALAFRRNTADKFFTRVFNCNPLDEACTPLLADFKKTFIDCVCQDDSFYCDANHPLRPVFHCLLNRANTWYWRDSKTHQQFFEQLAHIINLTCETPLPSDKLTCAISDFDARETIEEKRAAMLEARLCESELNYLKILTAECRALDLINEALTGSQLPPNVIDIIPTILKTELQHCALTLGTESGFWLLWKHLLPLLGDAFTLDLDDESDLEFHRRLPELLLELERSSTSELSNPTQYRDFISVCNAALIQVLQKQPCELQTLKMLPYPEGHSDTRTRITDSILQQGDVIQQGDWILFSSDTDTMIRCKLALKNSATNQLLFVDRTGRKVMIKSRKDFSLCFSTGVAKPLTQVSLDELLTELVQALITLHNHNVQKNIFSEQPATQPAATDEIMALRRSAEKSTAEAHILATEKAARIVAIAAAAKTQPAFEKVNAPLKMAQQQVANLNIGAWLERLDERQQKQRCKLAAIISATNNYIFVDSYGCKIAEYKREQLVDALLKQQLLLIHNGTKFEDHVANVIRNLRKDIN